MTSFSLFFFLATIALVFGDSDIVMKPIEKDGASVGLIIVQGAQIPTAAYIPLAKAIQQASDYNLYVVIPAFLLDIPEPLVLSKGITDAKNKLYAAGFPKGAPIVYSGHSLGGAMLQNYVATCTDCPLQILMGSGLLRKYNNATSPYPVPTLTLDGTLDGLMRVTRQAENYYHYIHPGNGDADNYFKFPVVLFEGMNHMQFASGTPPSNVAKNDLAPEISNTSAWSMTATTINDFLNANLQIARASVEAAAKQNLQKEVRETGNIVRPIILSLRAEGFKHFKPPCNSDYPMPECPAYPRYPSKAKGTTPQVNCTCGTPWVQNVAMQTMTNLSDVTIVSTDAIHPVSDITPVHLPHVWSKCAQEKGCTLNVTTVTYPVYDVLDGIDTGFYYTSASELKVKLKSRQAMWLAAGVPNVNYNKTDVNVNTCRDINIQSYEFALDNAGAEALARFKKIGQPLEFGDDIFNGNAGPIWIGSKLKYTEAADKSKVTITAPCTHTPVDYFIKKAAGFHYCKVLSPARAMEWIYIDGLRNKGSLTPKQW